MEILIFVQENLFGSIFIGVLFVSFNVLDELVIPKLNLSETIFRKVIFISYNVLHGLVIPEFVYTNWLGAACKTMRFLTYVWL